VLHQNAVQLLPNQGGERRVRASPHQICGGPFRFFSRMCGDIDQRPRPPALRQEYVDEE
jgi:hypothetical protein